MPILYKLLLSTFYLLLSTFRFLPYSPAIPMLRRPRRLPGIGPATAALVAAAIVLGQPASWLTVRGQQPTFRSAVDMIAIDVQVLGRDGKPVTTLGPESFDVTLNGQKRRVQWAVYTRYEEQPAGTKTILPLEGVPAPPPEPGSRTEPGRTFVIAIDAGSFRTLDAHVAVLAAQRFIDGLLPTDLVGVFTVPFGPSLLPTTYHAAARATVAKVVGRKVDIKSSFEFTPAEVIDILAAVDTKPRYQLEDEVKKNRGRKFTTGSDDQTWSDEVIAKHCTGSDPSCFDSVISEATSVAFGLETNAMMSIAGLEDLLKLLQLAGEKDGPAAERRVTAERSGLRPSERRERTEEDGRTGGVRQRHGACDLLRRQPE